MSLSVALHIASFLGCISASTWKNFLLTKQTLDRNQIRSLGHADRMATVFGLLIFATGANLAFASAGAEQFSTSALLWTKVIAFLGISAVVISTKPALRRAVHENRASWCPSKRTRWILRLDFATVLLIAAMGYLLANGLPPV